MMHLQSKALPVAIALALAFPIVQGKGGCPDGDNPPPLCFATGTRDECVQNGGCDENDGDCCCVHYTVPYCGVPSNCNGYLKCMGPTPEPMNEEPTEAEVKSEFQLLSTASTDAEYVAANNCPAPVGTAASSGGCPDGNNPPPLCYTTGTTAECVENGGCDANDADCCCVHYTVPYCGVPSDCNGYLKCMGPVPEPMQEEPSDDLQMKSFEFLMQAATDAAAAADCPAPTPSAADGFSSAPILSTLAAAGAVAAMA